METSERHNAGEAIADAVAAVGRDTPFGARPTIAWSADARRILYADAAARPLADALTIDASGRVRPDLAAWPRLAALAGGLAPQAGQRLEKLRFGGALAPLTTLACRRVTLPGGEPVLMTAFLGPLPTLGAAGRAQPAAEARTPADRPILSDAPAHDAAAEPDAASAEPEAAADPLARLAGRGVVRFVWRADAQGRFREVAPALGEIVGPQASAIVGRELAEVFRDVADDPCGLVAEHVARGDTFSGHTVLWRIDGTDQGVEVDLAGMPLLDRDRRLRETRGFGLVRTAAVRPFPVRAEPEPEPARMYAPDPADALADEPFGLPEPDVEPEDEPEREPAEAAAPDPQAQRAPADAFAIAGERYEPGPLAAAPVTLASLSAAVVARLGDAGRDAALAEASHAFAPREVANDVAPAAERRDDAPAPAPPIATQPVPAAAPVRLSPAEHSAFREIAKALGARYAGDDDAPATAPVLAEAAVAAFPPRPARAPATGEALALLALERLPIGVVAHRGEEVLYANRHLLDMLGHADLAAFRAAGGIAALVKGRPGALARVESAEPAPLVLQGADRHTLAAEVKLTTVDLGDGPASLLTVRRLPEEDPAHRAGALEIERAQLVARLSEQAAILDTATDGVVVLDDAGRIISLNRSAQALFGYEENEIAGEGFTTLFETESHSAALEHLDGVRRGSVAGLLDGGREVLGRVRQGGAIPLFMTLGRVGEEGGAPKYCAVMRDMTAFKQAEAELLAAKRAAEDASAHKSDFLARISHEVRTPLNAIIGFAEVMREERFGPVGNERYKDYLADIHSSGQHVLSLINDLLDLAKIEAGRMELSFRSVSLNELVTACVALIQPQAARDRIVVRTSFLAKLPAVVADDRSVRQIVLNLLSNAVKFTDAGGQVIVSTALTDRGEVAFRVRDTGIGMDDREVESALEPFRQLATARRSGGTGLGLPLTKALVEANRGAMTIASKKGEGTLVEVTFPVTVGAGV